MVTGDALAIARETAAQLDMGTNILDAATLGDSKKQETTAVAESIEKAKCLALQKLHIFNPISEYDLLRLSQENWADVKLENPS